MSEKQVLEVLEKEFVIEGTGKTKEDVYGSIFSKLRKIVYNEIKGVVLHMEPLEVYTLKESEKTFTEKFLWLFMPRTKQEFYMELKIIVLIKYISI